jgi:hypothetical protein
MKTLLLSSMINVMLTIFGDFGQIFDILTKSLRENWQKFAIS